MDAYEKLRALLREDIENIVEEALNKRLGAIQQVDPAQIKKDVTQAVTDYVRKTSFVTPTLSKDPDMDQYDVTVANVKLSPIMVISKKTVDKRIRLGVQSHEIKSHKDE